MIIFSRPLKLSLREKRSAFASCFNFYAITRAVSCHKLLELSLRWCDLCIHQCFCSQTLNLYPVRNDQLALASRLLRLTHGFSKSYIGDYSNKSIQSPASAAIRKRPTGQKNSQDHSGLCQKHTFLWQRRRRLYQNDMLSSLFNHPSCYSKPLRPFVLSSRIVIKPTTCTKRSENLCARRRSVIGSTKAI